MSTKRFRFSHVALAKQVMDDNDPEGAANYIMAVAGKDHPDKIAGAFKNVRVRIMSQPEYTNQEGEEEARALLELPGLEDDDKKRLEELLRMPISKQHWAQHIKAVFRNQELTAKYNAIRFFKAPFYDFKMPESVSVDRTIRGRERSRENHAHQRRDQSLYRFSEEEINDMMKEAIEYCQSDQDWGKKVNSCRLLEAVGLLTGRRKWELASALKIRSVPDNDYQAEVRGITKTLFCDESWRRIPLLAPISVIVSAISKIRRYAHNPGKYNAANQLFPKLTHTRYRDIYASKAYDQRDLNQFHPESCSLLWFRSKALLIDLESCAAHYSTLVIDRNEPEPERDGDAEPQLKKPRVEEEVANSSSGSQDMQFQDLV
jgi:hypothetical protein